MVNKDIQRFRSSTRKRESGSKFDFGLRDTKMVGNNRSPHLKMFVEVYKPLSAEMSEIFISGPKFRIGAKIPKLYLLSKNVNFTIFANYQLFCFIQCRQSV